MNRISYRAILGSSVLALGIGMTTLPALALGVTVNGSAVTLTPPPIERAGRVFVPLRGVFQQLGASVVYANGTINATGNNNTISLHIGSTQATVNGLAKPLDVAPFIVGASTYVPLRFVSQALGAGVNYDNTNQIVALTTSGSVAMQGPPPPMMHRLLRDEQPANNEFVRSNKPTISGNFGQAVDPNSVRLALDGLDVTNATTRSATGFIYAPPSPLQSMKHELSVTGHLAGGEPFSETYAFNSGSEAPHNTLQIISPVDGARLGGNFVIEGHTVPGGLVHIVAGASANFGGVFAFGAGSYTGDTIADGSGDFRQPVNLQTVPGAQILMTVTSTDPQTKESAEKKLRLRAQ